MTTKGFVRKPRISPPRSPGGETNVQPPPDVPRVIPGNLMMKLMPVVMVFAVVGMVAVMFVTGGKGALSNPLYMMFPLMMLMSMVGMFAGGGAGGGKKAGELNEERKDYFRYLDQLRDDVRDTSEDQRTALEWSHPDPASLVSVIGTRRMWERRPADHDFGHVRVGVGSQRLATRLLPPETGPLEDLEPVSAVALRRFVRAHSVVHKLPTAVSLRGFPAVSVSGVRSETLQLLRSMVMELCTFHGPDHLLIAVVCNDPDAEDWAWAKWLPHLQHPKKSDGVGSARMIYPSLYDLENALDYELIDRGRYSRTKQVQAGPIQLVVIIDDGYVSGDERCLGDGGIDNVSVIDLTARPDGLAARRGLRLEVNGGRIAVRNAFSVEEFADIDAVGVSEAETFARRIAPYRVATAAQIISLEQDSSPSDPGLMSLLNIPDAAAIDPDVVWRPRTPRERLRVPIGMSKDGNPVELDIKESAENGMGPHGLVIGATGSGKSEFLRTLVLSMITTHSPEALNLVLVDFKGGATFLGIDAAPHVAAVITNLEDELSMVDRMGDALYGEMNRRQELLRSAGNFANVGDYERARAAGKPLDPLPALFIIVDEFSELLSQKPDFAELFVAIGRLGRSLHMHLLLASQRLEEGKLRGLDSHLSYRIGLKTFSAGESRSVLGVPDAYHLPSVPGSGYLKCDSSELIRFNASYVSGPYTSPRSDATTAGGGRRRGTGSSGIKLFSASPVPVDPTTLVDLPVIDSPTEEVPNRSVGPTLLDLVVSRLEGHGRPAHEVWLPPLDESPTIDMLLRDPDWRSEANRVGDLVFPLGVVDRPYDQRRDALTIDVSAAQGNVAIVGGPQSGKSNALRALIMGAAATHTPEQVQFFCLDFGGGSLVGLADLPHVGSVATRSDIDGIRRSIAEAVNLVRQREVMFREQGIESMREYRRRINESGPQAGDGFGDLFLVIDGWGAIRAEFEFLEPQINTIVTQGLSYGVHLVTAASRWAELRSATKDLIGTRLELRLGDPMESEMGRKSAELVPVGRPGRGQTPQALHMLIGLPRLDSNSDPASLSDGVQWSVGQLQMMYQGRSARIVRKLDLQIPREQVMSKVHAQGIALSPRQVAIGLGESELAPAIVDFAQQPLLIVLGDVEAGKTTVLRNIVAGLMENADGKQNKIVLVDYRRTMLGVVDQDHLAGYATSAQALTPMISDLVRYFQSRIPGPDVTQEQLRARSWWEGPEIYLVVDDYDMVALQSGNPLAPLIELLPQARDIGLNLVVARRSGGANRGLFEQVLARMKDLSCDALLMSGDKDEGYLFGRSKLQRLPAGRGEYISRVRGNEMVQVGYMPPL